MSRAAESEAAALARECAQALNGAPSVIAAWLFGSMARGDSGPASDVDVAVLLDLPAYVADAGLAAAGRLQRLLQPVTSRDVQVVVLNDAAPALAHRALREGVLLKGESDPRRVTFETRVLAEAMDFQYYLDRYDRALLARARDGTLGA